jgi:hypothetical protein
LIGAVAINVVNLREINSMALFGFGQKPRPMGFDYTPLYYDPEKEKLDAKFGAARSGGMEGMKSRIKSGFRSKSAGSRPGYRTQARQSNIRVVVILALLLVVFYFFLRSNAFIGFLEAMSGTK